MDGKSLEQVRDALIQKWKRVGTSSRREMDRDSALVSGQTEMIDIAQTLEQMDRDTSLQEVERREVLAIERALAKISSGNFGLCEECTEEIPYKRLLVLPEARLCALCQTYEERQSARMRANGSASRA
jgi:DnaK suppressor protein